MSHRPLTTVLTLLCCLILPLSASFVWMYPFGRRPALLPSIWGGLSAYALDHGGWFPDSNLGPYDALTTLYPTYCTASELAGVSGNIGDARSALRHQKPLTGSTTSWIYFPGFRKD